MNYVAVGLALCGGMYEDREAGELGLIISRGSTFAITMVYGLTQLVSAVGTAAELSGHTRRVAALLRGLEHVDATTRSWRRREEEDWRPSEQKATGGAKGVRGRRRQSKEGVEPLLEGRQLCICVPPGQSAPRHGGEGVTLVRRGRESPPYCSELLSSVNLCVREGGSLLVRGAAGIGKTALLRTICGLWPMGEPDQQSGNEAAELTCVPPLWNLSARSACSLTYLVLPQSAPLRPGMRTTLVDQLIYPLLEKEDAHEAVREAVDTVGLSGLLDRLGGLNTPHSQKEWQAALSPGQRQLLICARIFVHMPALVLLDEATSAMPASDEARIYGNLKARGIAFVSIGHRSSLEPHHDDVMDL